jgi:flagellar motor switch/type III secretory pathway protein FliN
MTNSQQPTWLDDVPLDLEAAIAGPPMRVSAVLALRVGSVISTARPSGENIDVFAGGGRIGGGEFSANGPKAVLRMVRFGS